MNKIGGIIKERRLERAWSKRALAEKAGISHSEVHRIENGDRENPSVSVLNSLAEALGIPKDDMLMLAGYKQDARDVPMIERVFPDLKTEKKKDAARRIIDSLCRDDLIDDDVDEIVKQLEMALVYAKNKKNPE
ncbi:hypothetical protein FACS1894188_08990 [Clostridia bacterium]|nr:hypothetical protein FACS1894188_08990 [Clostridia bacterium]